MPEIYFSTLNSSDLNRGMETVLDEFVEKGVSNIEISSGHKYERRVEETLEEAVKKKKIKILLHNYSPSESDNILINLSDPNLRQRKRVVAFIKKRILLTKKLGADYYSFHGGFCVSNYKFQEDNLKNKIISQERARKYFTESVKEIVKYAEQQNVKVGFENHIVEKGNEKILITHTAKEIADIFKKIKSKNLFLHLDAGHLNVTANTLKFDKIKFIKKFKNKIYAVHLSKNNGRQDQHLQVDKNLWILPYLKTFKRLKYIVLETKGPINKSQINIFN